MNKIHTAMFPVKSFCTTVKAGLPNRPNIVRLHSVETKRRICRAEERPLTEDLDQVLRCLTESSCVYSGFGDWYVDVGLGDYQHHHNGLCLFAGGSELQSCLGKGVCHMP